MRIAFLATCAIVSASLWACGSNLSGGPGDSSHDAGHDSTVTVEAGEPDSHQPGMDGAMGRDTSPSGDASSGEGGTGEGGADVIEEPPACLPSTPDDATGVYVIVGGSTASNCGTRSLPCASIDLALQRIVSTPSYTTVYVGPGTFTEAATVALLDGVAIVGGWLITGSTVWSHSCIPPEVDGPSPVFTADLLTTTTTLDTLKIVETQAASTPGGSVYGVTSNGSALALNNVNIIVQPGGAGADGTTMGTMGSPGASGGCDPPGAGGAGGPGGVGNPTSAGTFSASGFTPASDGTNGATGATGGNGTMGAYGTEVMEYPPMCMPPTCALGSKEAFEGGTGKGGCPGMGGTGGTPGTGGGCSIGLYAWGGTVTLTGGALNTGNGGRGGNGAGGGMGGGGAAGAAGAQSSTYFSSCVFTGSGCKPLMGHAAGGAAGGNGGNGGNGGAGGGGAGGCSYGYYAGNGAAVTATGTNLNAGGAGHAGTPNGLTGPAAGHN